MFKKIVLAAIAASMFAVPVAQAQQRFDGPRHEYRQGSKPGRHYERPRQYEPRRHAEPKRYEFQRQQPRHHQRWAKGHRVPDWQRRQALRDYHRHGLKRPGRGQQWVKVDNDFLLITMATGVIAGIVAAGR